MTSLRAIEGTGELHLHWHGVAAADVAEFIRRQGDSALPSIED
jgi:hypothetical protein